MTFTRLILITALALAIFASPTLITSSHAEFNAEDKQWSPFNVLKKIFKKEAKKRKTTKTTTTTSTPTIVAVQKSEDARRVAILGDEMAAFLARGLTKAYAQTPDMLVKQHLKPGSGLVNPDFHDWPLEANLTVLADQPDFVVVMIGLNDSAGIETFNGTLKYGSDEWSAAYEDLAIDLLRSLNNEERPVIWVGLPPVRNKQAREKHAKLNSLQRSAVELLGARYIDIWDTFLNEDGNYSDYGPDVSGRQARLRHRNGVGFTRAGRTKLAFFVRTEIQNIIDDNASGIARLGGQDADKALGWKLGTVISLNSKRPAKGKVELAGATMRPVDPWIFSPQFNLMITGIAPAAIKGRVDDHRWKPEKSQNPLLQLRSDQRGISGTELSEVK